MKNIVVVLVFFLLLASDVFAADQTLTITIPDAYVSRVVAAFEAQHKCSERGLSIRQCAELVIRNKIKNIVKAYEKSEARKTAEGSVTDIEVN